MKILILASLILATHGSAQVNEPNFDVISDIDLGFFGLNPRLPWGGDPFLKEPGFANVPPENESHKLGAIVYKKGSPVAIVDGITVKEGDMVGDRQVSAIGENYVLLKKKGSEIELTLPPLREPASIDLDEEDSE